MNQRWTRIGWQIAGRTIVAEMPETAVTAAWARSMASHATTEPADRADLTLRLEPIPGWVNRSGRDGVAYEPKDAERPSRALFDKPALSGELVRDGTSFRGSFELNGDGTGPLDIAVRSCLSVLCEQNGELLIHASGVIRDGAAWLFCGPIKSGKTTIATELNRDGQLFSIDRTVVSPTTDGTLIAHSTPFSDERALLTGPARAEVAGICFIEQAAEHRVARMESYEVVSALMPQTLAFSRATAAVERTVAAAGSVAESGLCRRLFFARDDRFWDLLEPEEGARR
jgi:hypothetical protein